MNEAPSFLKRILQTYKGIMLLTPNHHDHHPFSGLFFLLLFLFLFISLSFPTPTYASCTQQDIDSLVSLSKISPPQNIWPSSSSSDCCSWDGVGCDGNDRVTNLSLPFKSLAGSIPLLNLSSLSYLNLSHNSLSGPLPYGFFSTLSSLRVVDLSYNRVSGQLPPSLPVRVQVLDFSSNHFNGTIGASFFASLPSLTSLNVSNNSLTGTIPSSICANSPSLVFLDFSYNDFTGSIPRGFASCSSLQVLRAGFNNLTGEIPGDIYSASLEELSFPRNSLSGPIDEGITSLRNLKILTLFGNQFTGSIPSGIGKLSSLEDLQLHINKLNGTVPPSLMNCTNLKVLNLRVNSLVGNLSSFDFSNFILLNTIDLGNNNFTGPLPLSLFSCKSLTAIRLATTRLEGEVPNQIMQLQSLSFLSLSNNSLTNINSALGILMRLDNLRTLTLSKNFYNETLPVDGIAGFRSLQILGLGGCGFYGGIPIWLSRLGNLEVVDLSQNNLTGRIPGWLGNLSNLFYLDVSQNKLWGGFPIELTALPALRSQQSLDQANNSYLPLPVFVQPNNASNLQYNQLINLPPALYLAKNNLSGDLPVEIGQLKSLHVLDLNTNSFSGSIPDPISNLTNLEYLDLSSNNLSGEIPASLKSLHFLSFFNVARNNLQGPIPTGGQFDTFPNTSFEGNSQLCGIILHHQCGANQTGPALSAGHKNGLNKRVIVGLILGICFGVGVTLTALALWVLSKRRILPRDEVDLDTILSFNSNSAFSTEGAKETSVVILFPNNTKDLKDLSISEILEATENFSPANIIGCGGFGLVYKATLPKGTKLAVKKLSGDMGLMEREFKAEVEALSTAQHKNLVSLQGYCMHDGFRLLIYSYMENGSLDYWLHEKADGASKLDWPTRLKIVRGAGCGLAYMHQICEPHIVHRDIKSSNILLDDQFEAYVADFGLSRLILPYHTHVTTELVGTLGYIPPEYSQSWIATLRGDVYSFGVVMLELLTGKRPIEVFRPKMSRELVVWVQQLRSEGKQDEIFDPLLKGKGYKEEMLQVLDVACMCVNRNPLKRPTINEIVEWLQNVGSNRELPNQEQE